MSRSNGVAQGNGQGQQWPETDAYGRPVDPRWAPPAQQAPTHPQAHAHPQYAQQPPQGYDAHAQLPAYGQMPAQGYGHPQHPQTFGEPAPGYHTDYPTAPPQHGYAPQHGHSAAHQAQEQQGYPQQPAPQYAPQPQQYDQYQQPAAAPQGHDRFDTQLHLDAQQSAQHQQYAQQGYATDPRAYGAAQHGHPASDPRGWDLGQYPGHVPAHAQQAAYESQHAAAQHGYAPAGHGAVADAAWQQQPGWSGQVTAEPHRGAFDPSPGHPGFEQPQAQPDAGIDEEEPRRRGPSAMLVVGGLIGAIALGGGLAFAYKKFGGSPTAASANKPPVVKADKTPTKTKPADPGGKQEPHTDKKIFGSRLGQDPPPQQSAAAQPPPPAAEQEGPKRVTTVIVNKDGSITPTVSQAAPPLAPSAQPSIPGMVVQGGPSAPDLRGTAPIERATQAAPVQKAPAQPRIVDLPLPKVKAEPPAAAAAPPPPKKKPAVRDDLVSQAAAATPVTKVAPQAQPGSGGANGFVAVLTSRQSREDALKQFADLHQKHPDILGGRTPDVREKDFGEAATGPKGVWYRLIVGHPVRRKRARICASAFPHKV